MAKAPALTLVRAELGRAARTRSTIAFLSSAALITLVVFTVRVLISEGSEEPASSALIILSADVVGFAVMFNTALAVARDYQSGANELVRVLVPARGRQLVALAAAHATLAATVVLVLTIVGTVAILTVQASAFAIGGLTDGLARLLVTTASLAFAGAGVGAFCRSAAATTFVVLGLYLLLPIGLMIAGFAGQPWAGAVSGNTLGPLASTAISGASAAWPATAGVVLWAAGLAAIGILRESKGR
jgi:hypothetical protein